MSFTETFNLFYTLTYDGVTYNVEENVTETLINQTPGESEESAGNKYTYIFTVTDSNDTLVGTLTYVLTYNLSGYSSVFTETNATTGVTSTVTVTAKPINGVYTVTIETDNSTYVVTEDSWTNYYDSNGIYSYTTAINSVIETSGQSTETYTITMTFVEGTPVSDKTYTVTNSTDAIVLTLTDTWYINSQGNYTTVEYTATNADGTVNTATYAEIID